MGQVEIRSPRLRGAPRRSQLCALRLGPCDRERYADQPRQPDGATSAWMNEAASWRSSPSRSPVRPEKESCSSSTSCRPTCEEVAPMSSPTPPTSPTTPPSAATSTSSRTMSDWRTAPGSPMRLLTRSSTNSAAPPADHPCLVRQPLLRRSPSASRQPYETALPRSPPERARRSRNWRARHSKTASPPPHDR